MKPFVMLVLFICLCSLYALTAPTNVRAAAIGHDAFTLRWDAVAGETGYEVYVNQGMEQFTMHNFDCGEYFPEGWTYERVSFISNYPNLSYSRNNFLSMDAAPGCTAIGNSYIA
ncbi:MAG: hypothetical protein LRZ88_12020 [Candidatus Cloacimonetes bacterium]|nr:hypothetical protein [Candidatus Cloacimonadota bacterium]